MALVARYPYVALGRGGLIKVGYTIDVKKRAQGLRQEFKAKGDELVRIEACEPLIAARSVELRVIDHCRATLLRHSGWEWFTGGSFDQVYAFAVAETQKWKHLVYREWTPPTAEETAALHVKFAAEKAARIQRRADAIAARMKRSAAREFRRTGPERVVQAFIAFATARASPS